MCRRLPDDGRRRTPLTTGSYSAVVSSEDVSGGDSTDHERVRATPLAGPVVLLVAGRADPAWAARTAVALSEGWAADGYRIVLADLHIESPLLTPDDAGGAMVEGIVDVFLYGASLARITRPMRDGQFYLIPAGTYASEPSEIYRNPRWAKVVAGFRDTGATLLLFVPADVAHLEELSAWSKEAILLGIEADDGLADRLSRHGIRVLGAVQLPPGEDGPGAGADLGPVPEAAEQPGISRASAGGGQRTANPAADLDLPPPPPRPSPDRKRQVLNGFLLLVAVVLVTLFIVGVVRPAAQSESDDAGADTTASVPAGVAAGVPLPYSVQVKAFTTFAAASEQLDIEEARLPDALFFISPEEIQGILYYRILAGQLADTLQASQLRDRLLEAGSLDEDPVVTYGQLDQTPLTFALGVFDSEAEAAAHVDSLRNLEVPSYIGVLPYSDGTHRWPVFAGAYRDGSSAAGMAEILSAVGVEGRLIARTGARPEHYE